MDSAFYGLLSSTYKYYTPTDWLNKKELRYNLERNVHMISGPTRDAPYGWSDALDGRGWYNWGWDMLNRRLEDSWEVYGEKNERVREWRALSFAFWDQERVEVIKSCPFSAYYKTGWFKAVC